MFSVITLTLSLHSNPSQLSQSPLTASTPIPLTASIPCRLPRNSSSAPPPHSSFHANLPLCRFDLPLPLSAASIYRCLYLPLPPPPRSTVASICRCLCHLDLPLPRSASAAALTRRPPHESAFVAASIYLCHRFHTNRPLSPPPHTSLPTLA